MLSETRDERISQHRILMFWVSPADSCTNDCDQSYVVYYQQSAIQRTCWPQFKRGGCRIPSRRVASFAIVAGLAIIIVVAQCPQAKRTHASWWQEKPFASSFILSMSDVNKSLLNTKYTLHIAHCSWKVSSMNGIKYKSKSVCSLERIVAWPQLDSGWRQELEWSRSGAPLLLFYQLIYWP